MKISDLKINPNNPQGIDETGEKMLKYKLLAYHNILKGRGIVYDSYNDNTILGGNKRFAILKEFSKLTDYKFNALIEDSKEFFQGNQNTALEAFESLRKTKEIPIEWLFDCKDWTDEEKHSFVINDNVNDGEWDVDKLKAQWEEKDLQHWGVVEWGEEVEKENEVAQKINLDDFGDQFSLPEGEKEPFQQMTFTFADAQAETIKEELKKAQQENQVENFGNENSNGNAFYRIVTEWAELKK